MPSETAQKHLQQQQCILHYGSLENTLNGNITRQNFLQSFDIVSRVIGKESGLSTMLVQKFPKVYLQIND